MASDVSVGDIEAPYLDVRPADGGTTGVLTVTAPDDTTTEPAVTAGTPSDGAVRLTASPVTFTQPGRWLLRWTVTGLGAGAEDATVYVVPSPTAGGPTWWPGRSRVANYVPQRTLVRSPASYTESGDTYELTFDSTTRPTGVAVDRLIADGAAWVSTRLTRPLHDSLHDAASVCVALYAAAAVERGWPHDDNSLQRATDLERRLDQMLADLVGANDDASGDEDPDVPQTHLSPVYSFPAPVPWGDEHFL
ncbi:hypothetical protein [Plantactinospora sp. WMMB782]|uniref:hypothetical protein n=1 Tax=Plantactinospora sp. WMMB782 TaxID=3404121 RepID=UPI003B95BD28